MPQYPNWSDDIHLTELSRVPKVSGVYKLYWIYGNTEVLQYIGQTDNLNRRLIQHTYYRWWNYARYAETRGVRRDGRINLEYRLIRHHLPPYNDY